MSKIKKYPAFWLKRHRSGGIDDHPQRYHINIGKRYSVGNFRDSFKEKKSGNLGKKTKHKTTGDDTYYRQTGKPDVLEKGAGTSFKLYGYNGEFKIALFRSKHYGGTIDTGFYNDKEKVGFVGSLYSGGETGFGRNSYEILTTEQLRERGYELITSDFSKVKELLELRKGDKS